MNKTVNINLANTFFHIDEEAYRLLEHYLKKLKSGFKETQGGEEILQDIEARIAELFQDLKTNPDYVINTADVEKIIEIMGEPETVLSEEEPEASQETIQRKLYRDPEDKYIGGVASGLGHYFKIDATWIRLIWLFLVLFSGGVFTLIYIVFWVLVPLAKTTGDQLRMKGKPVNIATIKKKIKEEFDEVTGKIKDIDYEKAGNTLKKKSKKFFQFLENLIKKIPSVILKLIGILLLLISIISIFGLLVGGFILLVFEMVLWPFYFFEIELFSNSIWQIGLFLTIFLPFLLLGSISIRLLRGRSNRFGSNSRLIFFSLWIIALGSVIYTGTHQIRKNRITATKTNSHMLPITLSDTLKIKLYDEEPAKSKWKFKKTNPFHRLAKRIENNHQFVSLNINSTESNQVTLEIQSSAKGYNQKEAQEEAEKITYQWNQKGHTLFLDNGIKKQGVEDLFTKTIELNLLLPKNQIIMLDNSLSQILKGPIKNNQNLSSRAIAGNTWQMGKENLKCLNCPRNNAQLKLQYNNAKGEQKVHLKVDKNGIQLKKD